MMGGPRVISDCGGNFVPAYSDGSSRDGIGFRKSDIDKFIANGGFNKTMLNGRDKSIKIPKEGDYIMSDVVKGYEDANSAISVAQKAYNETIAKFRGSIQNDLTSIAASANKVQREHDKIAVSARNAIDVLTSTEMQQAIANAERLAAALTAISELKSHNITFAVLDRKPQTE